MFPSQIHLPCAPIVQNYYITKEDAFSLRWRVAKTALVITLTIYSPCLIPKTKNIAFCLLDFTNTFSYCCLRTRVQSDMFWVWPMVNVANCTGAKAALYTLTQIILTNVWPLHWWPCDTYKPKQAINREHVSTMTSWPVIMLICTDTKQLTWNAAAHSELQTSNSEWYKRAFRSS